MQIEPKNKHHVILFIAYIEVTFLNSQNKIQLTDTSVIKFITDNLLTENNWKVDYFMFFRPEQSGIKL